MESQFNINDYTAYDIGKPHTTVKIPKGYIAHTERGIVVCLDSGLRYTCSYQHLISALKINAFNPDDIQVRENINDILGRFQTKLNSKIKEQERKNNEIETILNNLRNGKNE